MFMIFNKMRLQSGTMKRKVPIGKEHVSQDNDSRP